MQESKHISNKSEHPHQKPLDLLTKMIKHSSKEGDLVFDPFCGSGSTCLAAKINKRNWLGVEMDSKYLEISQKRLDVGGVNDSN